jgi:hypothetical protein
MADGRVGHCATGNKTADPSCLVLLHSYLLLLLLLLLLLHC